MVQFLPTSPDRMRQADLHPGDTPEGHPLHDPVADRGRRLDRGEVPRRRRSRTTNWSIPALSSERLLYRLFHERGVRVFEAQPVHEECRCSRERIMA